MLVGAWRWAAAQVLEVVQRDGDVRQFGHRPMMVTEELAEAWGTGLFLLAAASVVRSPTAAAAP